MCFFTLEIQLLLLKAKTSNLTSWDMYDAVANNAWHDSKVKCFTFFFTGKVGWFMYGKGMFSPHNLQLKKQVG